ncbi:MAG: hypothetical protein ACYS32_02685 [Planctomycetota bacterium]
MGKVLENLITLLAEVIVPRNPAGNEDSLQIAELPSHGRLPASLNARCILGPLADTKEWFVTAPAPVRISDGKVGSSCQGKAPYFDTIVEIRKVGKKLSGMYLPYQQIVHSIRYYVKKGGEAWKRNCPERISRGQEAELKSCCLVSSKRRINSCRFGKNGRQLKGD